MERNNRSGINNDWNRITRSKSRIARSKSKKEKLISRKIGISNSVRSSSRNSSRSRLSIIGQL